MENERSGVEEVQGSIVSVEEPTPEQSSVVPAEEPETPKIRDPKTGRFVKGHPRLGGRVAGRSERQYYDILASECTRDDWRKICHRAVRDAVRGNRYAREWIAERLMGPVTQRAQLEVMSESVGIIGWMEMLAGGDDVTVAEVEPEEDNI